MSTRSEPLRPLNCWVPDYGAYCCQCAHGAPLVEHVTGGDRGFVCTMWRDVYGENVAVLFDGAHGRHGLCEMFHGRSA